MKINLLTLLLLFVIKISAAQTPFVHYKMDNSGNDESANKKHGVPSFLVPANDRNGNTNSAYTFFPGNGSKFEVADTSGFGSNTGNITIGAWFRTDNKHGINSLFTSGFQSFMKGVFFSVSYTDYAGHIAFGLGLKPGSSVLTNLVFVMSEKNTYCDGLWHHAAVVVDKSNNKIMMYVDGERIKIQGFSGFGLTCAGTFENNNTELNTTGLLNNTDPSQAYIGIGSSSGLVQNIEGDLDEVYYFKSALTDAQVKQMMNGNATGTGLSKASSKVNVYPNPAKNQLTLYKEGGESLNAVVYDMAGSIKDELKLNTIYTNFNIESFSPGIYLIRFEDGSSKKFIKE